MNTHGATVNRGEIVSMYAGLKVQRFTHNLLLPKSDKPHSTEGRFMLHGRIDLYLK